ncbi:hypothetical protein J7E68_03175 [Microbacterium sp. ISL-103]|uniref:nucleotide-binding domain-containing protein n=1 Tax=Microbacterium sp. ISL-103 TaxID=2819156 RepID=UPI001BEC2FC7|nr:nucleotidyltransferase [Microbacterium sp. ISL-103]MBT2473602.1 hypothetical protein [Microbacterium sp. ISL-103]
MDTAEIFETFLTNLSVENAEAISTRRDEITKALNKEFRDLPASTASRLMVGSYGRYTAIRGISDLDMIFILPDKYRDQYTGENGPRRVLERVRKAILNRYPRTEVAVDQCVVRVQFTNFKFEVQPAFEEDDESFLYPDTVAKAWKVTKPRAEIAETSACSARTSGNMRKLARMARAWKNQHGVVMGGLLIDTLVHRFFAQTTDYDAADEADFGLMARDFFQFLADEEDRERYHALGSGQWVKVRKRFQPRAKKAYNLAVDAVDADGKQSAHKKWRAVFGSAVPKAVSSVLAASAETRSYQDTEEFVEDQYPVDVRYTLSIDCKVTQDGFQPRWLRRMMSDRMPLRVKKTLDFVVNKVDTDVPPPYEVRWKILNRGPEAERRDNIRGQIVKSDSPGKRREHTEFRGEHQVEAYAIKNGVVVARDEIDVPIRID